MYKTFKQFNENQEALEIILDKSKIKKALKGEIIMLGNVGQVAQSTLTNIKKTYPNAVISIEDGQYVLKMIN